MSLPAVVAVGLHLQADDAGAVAGEDGGDAGLLEELLHLQRRLRGVGLGDELAVVGEGALDERRHQLRGLAA